MCRLFKIFLIGQILLVALAIQSKASAEELWIKGFGPVEFGQKCQNEDQPTEMHNFDGFLIEAHCFEHQNIYSGKIFEIVISTKKLSFTAAKDIISARIREKDESIEPYWLRCIFDPFRTWSKCENFLVSGVASITGPNCSSFYKNQIVVYESDNSTKIKIIANKLQCREKKRLRQLRAKNDAKRLEKEKQSSSSRSFSGNLK